MRSLQDISNTFHAEYGEHEAHNRAMRAKLDQLEQAAKRYQRLAAKKMGEHNKLSRDWNSEPGVYWTDRLLLPLLEEIEERTGWTFDDKDDLRTFGLRAECPVYIRGEGVDEYGYRNIKAGITFTPELHHDTDENTTWELHFDTGEHTDSYPAGSIGELNGFGNKTAKVESVEQVIDFLQKQMTA